MNNKLHEDIINALRNDGEFNFKEVGKYFQQGRCPYCGRKSLFISKDSPHRIACSHKESCNGGDHYNETTRERYKDLFEELSKRYPATREDPEATAKAYMSEIRGFPLNKIANWFTQGVLPLGHGRFAPTVRFNLWDGYYWERLINSSDVRIYGDKNHNKAGLIYKNKHWAPPNLTIDDGDTVFIVEGIFHAIALTLIGKKAIAAFSSNNLPRDFIKQHSGKNITWAFGYDNDENEAGNKAAVKYRNELRKMGEKNILIFNCPVGEDWDDVYRKGELNEESLEKFLLNGRINTAESLEEKAVYMYRVRSYTFRSIEYGKKLYTVSPGTYTKDIEDYLDHVPDFKDKNSVTALELEDGQKLFERCMTKKLVCTAFPSLKYAEVDEDTKEIFYNFKIQFPNNMYKSEIISVPGSSIDTPSAFNKALLNKTVGAKYKGKDIDYEVLFDEWFLNRVPRVTSINYIGYNKETNAYVFPKFAFQNGARVKLNNYGYYQLNKGDLKVNSKSIDIHYNAEFNTDWINDFYKAFSDNGLITLAFFMGSLFAQQVRKKIGYFPFLELTGEPGTGKSTVIEFCQKLIGRDQTEGLNPSKASKASLARALSQLSNMPLVLIEGDSNDENGNKFNYAQFKDAFNGRAIRTTGKMNRGNDFNEPLFLAALMFAQNNTIVGDEATLSRIVHLHSTRKHHSAETKPIADWFRQADVKDFCGFLTSVLSHDKKILDTIFYHYDKLLPSFVNNPQIDMVRIAECHALFSAMVKTLVLIFPNINKQSVDNSINYLVKRAVNRQIRCNDDHPTVIKFWEVYAHLNWKSDSAAGMDSPELVQWLNHSLNDSKIAISLQEVIERSAKTGNGFFDSAELKPLLKQSKKRKFIGIKTIQSSITGKSKYCWIFQKCAEDIDPNKATTSEI